MPRSNHFKVMFNENYDWTKFNIDYVYPSNEYLSTATGLLNKEYDLTQDSDRSNLIQDIVFDLDPDEFPNWYSHFGDSDDEWIHNFIVSGNFTHIVRMGEDSGWQMIGYPKDEVLHRTPRQGIVGGVPPIVSKVRTNDTIDAWCHYLCYPSEDASVMLLDMSDEDFNKLKDIFTSSTSAEQCREDLNKNFGFEFNE